MECRDPLVHPLPKILGNFVNLETTKLAFVKQAAKLSSEPKNKRAHHLAITLHFLSRDGQRAPVVLGK